jgi:transcriptional regulator with XRE-family HTH domain
MNVFQKRLKEVMEEKGIKAATLARETGISPAAISKYLSDENKKHNFVFVLKIANYLDVSPEWLGGATDERKPFNEPTILDIYQKLSDDGKKELYNFASYLLRKETEENK